MGGAVEIIKRLIGQKQSVPGAHAIDSLDDPFQKVLLSMYRGDRQRGEGRETYDLDLNTQISTEEGMWIYELCREVAPRATLEIGLAYGFSMLYFLAARSGQ